MRKKNKSKEKSPAFQFYPNDFLSDPKTLVMSAEEIGVYWLLICICWKDNGLPKEIKKLSRLARVQEKKFSRMWKETISECFYFDESTDQFRHRRLDKELEKQVDFTERQKNAADARWESRHASGNAETMPSVCSSSSSSSSSSELNTNAKNSECVNATGLGAPPDDEIFTHSQASLLEYFQQKHVEKLKRKTNLYDTDRVLPKLHALVRTHGRDSVVRLVDLFFDEDRGKGDKWLQSADYSFSVFASQCERLAQGPPKGPRSNEDIAREAAEIIANRRKESGHSGMH